MSALINYKHFWSWRNGKGQYAYKPKFWPVFVSLPVIGLMVWIGNTHPLNVPQAATMADMSARVAYHTIKDTQCKDRVCDLTEPETKAKWDKWEKSPMKVLSDVCASKGLAKDAKCPVVLAAMARQESTFGKNMVGDGGHAHGWFQLNDTWHKVTASCSSSLACSASYTLDRMIRLGYKTNWEKSVRLHNGSATNPKTKTYLALVKHWMATFVPTL